MENVRQIVARNVRAARKRAGISQEELADLAGIDRTYASGIERAVRNPTIVALAKIADALGLATADLLDDSKHR
jgi:transcriptional regulator with XRE-family HTH domain